MADIEKERALRLIHRTREDLLDLFEYRDGALLWRQRARETFATQRAFSCWNAKFPGVQAGRLCNGYVRIKIDWVLYSAHRIIYFMHTGQQPAMLDHADGDRANNRIENLRPADASGNQANRPGKNGKLKGAHRCSYGNKWFSTIRRNGTSEYLGLFDSEEAAHAAYQAAAARVHGEFAWTTSR